MLMIMEEIQFLNDDDGKNKFFEHVVNPQNIFVTFVTTFNGDEVEWLRFLLPDPSSLVQSAWCSAMRHWKY